MKKNYLFIALLFVTTIAFASVKPKVHIIATGGTIAGAGASSIGSSYEPGKVGINVLIKAVPELLTVADVTGEQFCQIASQDFTDTVWLNLAKRINKLLATDSIDGVIVTHGTDTMEETAFFLNLTVKSNKPVVVVGSMRPTTALSADGAMNLFNAVVVASSPKSKGKGVLVSMNGKIYSARSVTKTNTVAVETFQSPNDGSIGYVFNGKPYYQFTPLKKHTVNSDFDIQNLKSLPKVGIIYGYADIDADMISPILNNNYQGVVIAGVGNGNLHKRIFPPVVAARKKGVLVVRSSRVPTGPTTLDAEVDDNALQFVAAQEHNPQKSRILLMLALTKTKDWKKIQQYFNQY